MATAEVTTRRREPSDGEASASQASRIPAGAIPEHYLSLPRSTAFDLFKRLERQGCAWMAHDRSRWFDGKHPHVLKHLANQAGRPDDDWEKAPPEKRYHAQQRCTFLEWMMLRLGQATLRGDRLADAYPRVMEELGPEILGHCVPFKTFWRWKRSYLDSGRLRSSMLDPRGRTGPRSVPFAPELWTEFENRYLTVQRRSIADVYTEIDTMAKERGLPWACEDAVRKRVRKVWPAPKADYHRLSRQQWLAKYGPKKVRDRSGLAANHTWEVDHFQFDFFARLGDTLIRPWCTVIIDRGSGVPVGWCITNSPSTDSLILALKMAVERYGACKEIVLDNGKDMAARCFGNKRPLIDAVWANGVFQILGIVAHWCRVKTPWAKGQVEAFARTVHGLFDRRFPSYCGGSHATRPEGTDAWCREHLAELPSIEQVREKFAAYVAAFIERPSDAAGIKPLSPRQRFEQTRIAKRTLPADQLRLLLLKPVGTRRVTPKGVLYQGINYWHDGGRLFEFQGQELLLKVDPGDASYAWVFSLKGKPLFRVTQNLVPGTWEDVRRGANARKRAIEACRRYREIGHRRLDDTATATFRAIAERNRQVAAVNEPTEPPSEPNVTPIVSPAAQAVTEAADVVQREAKYERARRHSATSQPPASRDVSLDELDALLHEEATAADTSTEDDIPLEELLGVDHPRGSRGIATA